MMIMASVAPDPPSGEIPNIRSIKSIGCLPVCICAYAQCDVLAMRPTARLTHRLIGWPSGKCDGPTVAARGQCRRLVIALAQGGLVLTEGQLAAMENATSEKEANGEFESECPYCGAQDTFYVGNLKGVGRIYQNTPPRGRG
jgi:hypothetical protein